MNAWSGDPVPVNLVEGRTPLELQGAAVFQYKNCRNCHALDGIGGRRGPDLTTIGASLTRDQLIDSGQQRHARRRQHAGLRQADEPGRDGSAHGVPDQPAARRATPRRATRATDCSPSKARRRSRSN